MHALGRKHSLVKSQRIRPMEFHHHGRRRRRGVNDAQHGRKRRSSQFHCHSGRRHTHQHSDYTDCVRRRRRRAGRQRERQERTRCDDPHTQQLDNHAHLIGRWLGCREFLCGHWHVCRGSSPPGLPRFLDAGRRIQRRHRPRRAENVWVWWGCAVCGSQRHDDRPFCSWRWHNCDA
jgi:hypothetical protein